MTSLRIIKLTTIFQMETLNLISSVMIKTRLVSLLNYRTHYRLSNTKINKCRSLENSPLSNLTNDRNFYSKELRECNFYFIEGEPTTKIRKFNIYLLLMDYCIFYSLMRHSRFYYSIQLIAQHQQRLSTLIFLIIDDN